MYPELDTTDLRYFSVLVVQLDRKFIFEVYYVNNKIPF